MSRVRYTGNGSYRNRAGVQATPDDPVCEVDEEMAEYLVSEWDFELDVETCQVEKSDGDICGRELPCPYHSDDPAEE